MKQNKQELEKWQRITDKCVTCGLCRSVCPVFLQMNHETVVARGKVSLIKALLEQKQVLTPRLNEILGLCLVCKTCTVNCPSGVPIDQLVTRARTAFETKPVPVAKRLVFSLVRRHSLMNSTLRLAGKFQKLFFKNSPGGTGMYPRLPIGISRRRLLAPLAGQAFVSQKHPRIEGKMKAAFFTGCMINHIYHNIGSAVLQVLSAGNIEVIVPKDQACCGTPLSTSGDRSSAAELAKHNIEVLLKQNVDAVVVACASCGLSLKKEYVELCSEYNPDLVEKAQELSSKTYDISEFYTKFLTDLKPVHPVNRRVTYHDPCHLIRGQGITQEPRQIIKSVPGVEYIEASGANKCCGSGGTFSLLHYDLATAINDEKVENLGETGADAVVTGCPACIMHISDGMARNNIGLRVMHTVEVLAAAIRNGQSQS
ncbi:hypothetical protein SY88_20420 [Clostridiales bacterium PH28_bin88]|nr:hypothetical protein SY88_20420 [Clostridiales bacterium PH28_bin88]